MMREPQPFSVLNLPIHLADNYTLWLLQRWQQGKGTHVVTLNAEMAIQAERIPELARVLHGADLVIPDGAGIVLYLRLRGKRQRRYPGIELAESLLTVIAQNLGTQTPNAQTLLNSCAFYGGAPGIAQRAAQAWQQKCPELAITSQHGFLSEAEQTRWDQTLQTQQPRVIFVGLGVPRQEYWIVQHRHLCPHSIWIGVGGSFDIWAGNKTRAPAFFRHNHLEWLYRLYQEPWRWRRMLALPQFFWRSLFVWKA